MVTIILLRHGESTANVQRVLAGRLAGVELTDRGREQVAKVAQELPSIDVIRHSTIDRCVDTARIVASNRIIAQSSDVTIEADSRFDEVDYGEWSGLALDDLRTRAHWERVQQSPHTFEFPGGEAMTHVFNRAVDGLTSLINDLGPGQTGLIVSHGDVIKAMVAHAVGAGLSNFQRFGVQPAQFCVLHVQGQTMTLSLGGSRVSGTTLGGEC
ncbi:histidine phosphatase family protein [Brevibacterium paucivorans]|uniref:histidine phosphatase family protein n=1 Tax=Brevibacterium paucivorans TaxID=170994 RepID=UPI00321B7569